MKALRSIAPGLLLLALVYTPVAAADNQVAISGEVNIIAEGDGEVVAIGGDVRVSGQSNDELVAIGGVVAIDVQSEDETVVIGGEIEIRGAFAGELVAIGGVVDYYGANTEELVLIGGELTVHEEAVSGGRAHIFGGELELAGRFAAASEFGGGHVTASGQFADTIQISAKEVIVSGEFYGDLNIEGETIRIDEGAVITGHLTVRSPNQPVIAEGIEFQPDAYTYEYIEEYDPKIGDVALSDIIRVLTGAFFVLAIILCGVVLAGFIIVAASSRLSRQASAAFRFAPGKSFLVGLATALITGFVGAFFLIILVGPLLPLLVAVVGYFIAAYTLSAIIFRKVGTSVSGGARVGYTALGTIILLGLNIVPFLGTLVVCVLTIIGMGAFVLALFNAAPEVEDGALVDSDREPFDDGHPRDDFDD